ncbi:MAG: hypothetical protein N2116_02800 [Armatimonadetes bacterium]|nr:hypothetical protein [Armatimonadota bacterium]
MATAEIVTHKNLFLSLPSLPDADALPVKYELGLVDGTRPEFERHRRTERSCLLTQAVLPEEFFAKGFFRDLTISLRSLLDIEEREKRPNGKSQSDNGGETKNL